MQLRHLIGLVLTATLFFSRPMLAQFTQQGPKLVGTGAVVSTNGFFAEQGFRVALSGDGKTAVVGGGYDGSVGTGAAWIWTRDGLGVWTQQGDKLVGSGSVRSSFQGQAVALSADGNTAAVGGPGDNFGEDIGAIWIWTRTDGVWTQQGAKLVAFDSGFHSEQGSSLALSADGNTLITGGEQDNNDTGAAWVWTRTAGVWSQQGVKLVASDAIGGADQGFSVGLSADGNTAIIGGAHDNNQAGAVWIWTRNGDVWTKQAKLLGTGAVGTSFVGQSVAISGDGNTVIFGGSTDNGNIGAAWVWTRSGQTWSQQGDKLVASDAVGTPYEGSSVSLSFDGNTAIVGGSFDAMGIGAVWVWRRDGGIWTQQGAKLVGSDAVNPAVQGISVSLSADGNEAIEGGPLDNSQSCTCGGSTGAGAAWIFAAPDLTISSSHSGSFTQGDHGDSYTLLVTNHGAATTAGTVTVTDTLPAGLTPTGPAGTIDGWDCSISTQVLTCTRSDALAMSASYPEITVSVDIGAAAPAVANVVSVSGGGQVDTSDDVASDPTSIIQLPSVLSVSPSTGLIDGGTPITINGTNFRSGAMVTFDGVPATGVQVLSSTTVTANSPAHAPGAVEVTVTNSDATAGSLANAFTYTIPAAPNLTITCSHPVDFRVGDDGDHYMIIVTNHGNAATAGTVTVTDTLPATLVPLGPTGTENGWQCAIDHQILTCSRNDVLGASASYPPLLPSVLVGFSPPTVTNVATVSGGGEVDVSDDTASDVTTIIPLSIVSSVSPSTGSADGGTPVTILGVSFKSGLTLTFGGVPATNVVLVDSTTITAIVPPHAPGPVEVTVAYMDGTNSSLEDGFTYTTQFDPNGDSLLDPSDIFFLINYLFTGGSAPMGAAGLLSGDANGDGLVDPNDIFYMVNYLFLDGPAPHSRYTTPMAASSSSMSGSVRLGSPVIRKGRYFVPVIVAAAPGSVAPQAMSLRIHFDNDGEPRAAEIHRVGNAMALHPSFETSRWSGSDLSYLVSFAGNDSFVGPDPVVFAEIELSGPIGQRLTASIDPVLTMLANRGGTMKATVAGHSLEVTGLTIVGTSTRPPGNRTRD